MSLANVLAISQAAKSIILLGDPQPTSPTPAEFIHRNLKNARQLWAFAIQ